MATGPSPASIKCTTSSSPTAQTCRYGSRRLAESTYTVSAAQQAQYYGDLITAVKARPWIRALFPYCLREWGNNTNDQSQYGLLTYPTWQPKPAYQTLQAGFPTLS